MQVKLKNTLDKNLVDTKQLASYFGVSVLTIRQWVRRNKLLAHKLGKRYYFLLDEVAICVRGIESDGSVLS